MLPAGLLQFNDEPEATAPPKRLVRSLIHSCSTNLASQIDPRSGERSYFAMHIVVAPPAHRQAGGNCRHLSDLLGG